MSNTMEKESTPRKHRGRTWLIIGMCATLALVYQTGRSAGMRSLPTDCHCENCTCGGDCSCDRTSAVPQEPSAALPEKKCGNGTASGKRDSADFSNSTGNSTGQSSCPSHDTGGLIGCRDSGNRDSGSRCTSGGITVEQHGGEQCLATSH